MSSIRKEELRLVFRNLQTPRISGRQLVELLRSVGLGVQPELTKTISHAFEAHGGFYCDDFVDIAESLGYSTNAAARAAEALRTIEYKESVNLVQLERMIEVCGKGIGLKTEEAAVFLSFQLGALEASKGRISMRRALELIN